jgi:hypothetical protein
MKHLKLTFLLIPLTVFSVSVLLAQGGRKSDAPNKQAPKKVEDTWERQKECLKLAEADIARTTPLSRVLHFSGAAAVTSGGAV